MIVRSPLLFRGLFGLGLLSLLFLQGCVSARYKLISEKKYEAPPTLEIAASDESLEVRIPHVIVFGAPGSWKEKALWDEYVVVLTNLGTEPIEVTEVILTTKWDPAVTPGHDPWEVERVSKGNLSRYQEIGVEVVKGAGVAAVAYVGFAAYAVSEVSGGLIVSGSAGAAAGVGGVILLPVYYGYTLIKNHSNRKRCEEIFAERRLELPVTIDPGASVQGSLFFPITPDPQLARWAYLPAGSGDGAVALEVLLTPLAGLHLEESEEPEGAGDKPVAP